MLGELAPLAGEVRRSNQVRFALVNQHHADQIDFNLTPLQYMLSVFPGDGSYAHEQALRGHLSTCGVTGERDSGGMACISYVVVCLLAY